MSYPITAVYLDYNLRWNPTNFTLGPDGIPRTIENGVPVIDPLTVIQYGLWRLSVGDMAGALQIGEWLLANQVPQGASGTPIPGVWPHNFPFIPVNGQALAPGWQSCITQGQAISLLIRLFLIGMDGRFLTSALNSMTVLRTAVDAGGCLVGSPVSPVLPSLSQYPTPVESHVVNGWMAAILGVFELSEVGGDLTAARFFWDLMDGLMPSLVCYDNAGGPPLYDLSPHVCGRDYLEWTCVVMDALYAITQYPQLTRTSSFWRAVAANMAV
jgi:hypothetical protein